MPRGGGAENIQPLGMLLPSAGREGVIDFVTKAVDEAWSRPCPPLIIGVGVGGAGEGFIHGQTLFVTQAGSAHSPKQKSRRWKRIFYGALTGWASARWVTAARSPRSPSTWKAFPAHIYQPPGRGQFPVPLRPPPASNIIIRLCFTRAFSPFGKGRGRDFEVVMAKKIRLPLNDRTDTDLKAGESVLLSGTLYTARDAAHKRMVDALERGEKLSFDIKGQTLYYTGPSPAPPGRVIGSAGPRQAPAWTNLHRAF